MQGMIQRGIKLFYCSALDGDQCKILTLTTQKIEIFKFIFGIFLILMFTVVDKAALEF